MQWFSSQYGPVSSLITLHEEGVLSALQPLGLLVPHGATTKLLFPHVCPLTRYCFPQQFGACVISPLGDAGQIKPG